MGADQSSFDQSIYPQRIPICATENRFCLPRNVQLRLREKLFSLSGDDFKISDAVDTSIVYFQCEGRALSFSKKKVLTDNMGVPVLNMKHIPFSFLDKFRIFAGDGSDNEICIFSSRISMLSAKLSTTFKDKLNGAFHYLVLKGDWWARNCTIYLGEPKHGGVPVARIFRPISGRTFMGVDDYILEVAAGVDIAMCAIMCIALDEHSRD